MAAAAECVECGTLLCGQHVLKGIAGCNLSVPEHLHQASWTKAEWWLYVQAFREDYRVVCEGCRTSAAAAALAERQRPPLPSEFFELIAELWAEGYPYTEYGSYPFAEYGGAAPSPFGPAWVKFATRHQLPRTEVDQFWKFRSGGRSFVAETVLCWEILGGLADRDPENNLDKHVLFVSDQGTLSAATADNWESHHHSRRRLWTTSDDQICWLNVGRDVAGALGIRRRG